MRETYDTYDAIKKISLHRGKVYPTDAPQPDDRSMMREAMERLRRKWKVALTDGERGG